MCGERNSGLYTLTLTRCIVNGVFAVVGGGVEWLRLSQDILVGFQFLFCHLWYIGVGCDGGEGSRAEPDTLNEFRLSSRYFCLAFCCFGRYLEYLPDLAVEYSKHNPKYRVTLYLILFGKASLESLQESHQV